MLASYRENPSLSEERIVRQCQDDLGPDFKLADAQRVVARENGFDSWTKLKQYLEAHPPEQLIFDAVAKDDADAVKSLLADDATLINVRSGWRLYRPLFFAIQDEQESAIVVLRQHGATLDVFEAASLGSMAELRTLLTDSPELANAHREHYDGTPLHAARENVEAARLLIEFGADVNAIDGEKQQPIALHGRAEHGDVEMVELLLEHGADVYALSCMSTPLHCAVGGFQHAPPKRWREVAERLLKAGADVNAFSRDDNPWTPLHHAAWRNHIAAVDWLLENGADKTQVNENGSIPLGTAQHFDHKEIIEILSLE